MTVDDGLFRSAFRTSPIGMAVLDESGMFIDVNSALANLLGRQADDLIGRPFVTFAHQDDLVRDEYLFDQVTSGSLSYFQILTRCLDDQENILWVRVTLTEADSIDPETPRKFVIQVEDVTEHHQVQGVPSKSTPYDHVTGLPTTAILLGRLDRALHRHASGAATVGVLVCDIDHFSVINDTFGYESGTTLLAVVAQRIRATIRPEDTVARNNADGFIVVLEDCADITGARAAAEAVAAAVRQPILLTDQDIVPTLSIGFSVADESMTAETLIRDADAALVSAKETGPSRIEEFRPDLRKVALNRFAIEAGLQAAVREGNLVVHYQPIVDLANRQISAYEALVRWAHPTRGLLLPEEFIEISEKANLVALLGSFVLEEACDFAVRHPDFDGQVFVNVSTRQIGSANLTSAVSAALDASGIDPRRLCLEITETGMLLTTETSRVDLENIASLGVTLVLDDFGQGYSALSTILLNPVTGLKLSKEYTDRLGESAGDRVSSAIAKLTAELGITGIIEGIETEDQHAAAVRHGWRFGQGFLYGHPLPEEELPLETHSPGPAVQPDPPTSPHSVEGPT